MGLASMLKKYSSNESLSEIGPPILLSIHFQIIFEVYYLYKLISIFEPQMMCYFCCFL